jgi:hypothetical protein
MKTKGADHFDYGTDDLFFVEIELMQGEHEELVVSRFCIITPNDNDILHSYLKLNIIEIPFHDCTN